MARFFKTIFAVLGWVCVAFAFLGLMVSLAEGMDGMDISMVIFFAVVGAGLIYAGKKNSQTDNNKESIQVNVVLSDQAGAGGEAGKSETTELKQTVCASCGARIHVGSGGTCEYCGSPAIPG
ncbi:MAG TPA: hypothetical protein DER60_03735 [Syntrophomonas sp.]|jgi:hypothetical protein|nr:hypothetical protein [Syntrophomonas sp.]